MITATHVYLNSVGLGLQTAGGQCLKKNLSSPPTPMPKDISYEELYFSILITIFVNFLQWLSVHVVTLLFFFDREGFLQKPSMFLFLSCESAVINMSKVASLPFIVSRSKDHGHPHGLWCHHVFWPSAWSLVAVQTTDINMAFALTMGTVIA